MILYQQRQDSLHTVCANLPIAILSAGTERSSSSFSSSVTGGTKLTYADLGGAGWGMEASHRPTFAAPVAAFHSLSDVNPAASFPPAASAGLQGIALNPFRPWCVQLVEQCVVQCTSQSNESQLPCACVLHQYIEITTRVHEHILHRFSVVL